MINCPECKKEISDKAQACPNCGLPIEKNNSQPPSSVVDIDGPGVNVAKKGTFSSSGKLRIRNGLIQVKGLLLATDIGKLDKISKIIFRDKNRTHAEFHFSLSKKSYFWIIKEQSNQGELQEFSAQVEQMSGRNLISDEITTINILPMQIVAGIGIALLFGLCVAVLNTDGDNNTQNATRNVPKVKTPPVNGKWLSKIDKSSFDDSKTVVLQLEAENKIQGWLTSVRPTLVLACRENKTLAYVNVEMAANPELGKYNSYTARMRIGSGTASKLIVDGSDNNEALFLRKPITKIKNMLNRKTMLFAFTPFNARTAEIKFNITGLENAIKPLRKVCRW